MNELLKIKNYEIAEKEYANSYTGIRELSKKYKLNRGILSGWLLAKGFSLNNRRASKSFNTSYFDSIDTEEKAYWLGFLFADGAIGKYKTSYNIELSLCIDDKSHVERFAKSIGKMYTAVSKYRTRCSIGSKHMYEILSSYGCTQRKSLTLTFPKESIFKNKELIRHFIRGYVEGDGCLTYSDKQHTKPYISILGTSSFLNGIQNYYKSNKKLQNNSKNQEITKVLSYSGKSAYIFAKFLYDDCSIYLDRKYKRYKEYCRLYEES